MTKPCTFDIANVLMMKSEYGSFLSRVTLMPPYVSEPSPGQYWAHFFLYQVIQCTFHTLLKRNIQYCAPISTLVSLLIKYFLHILLKSKEIIIIKQFNIYRFRDQKQTLFHSSRFASMTILPQRSCQTIRQKSAIVESRVPIKRIILTSTHINMQNRCL